jgi:RNA polymerase primary sigma factor
MSSQWYLNQIGRVPRLPIEQEIQLSHTIQAWLTHPEPVPALVERRGRRARDRFIAANLRLVINVAKKFRTHVPSHAFGDLVQAGNIGLIDAVERFDPTRGYRFSTYAWWWIQMRITAHLEQSEPTIRLPTTISHQVATIPRVTRRLMAELKRQPTRDEIANALKISSDELDRFWSVGRTCVSLDATVRDEESFTLGDMIAAPAPSAEIVEVDVIELRQQLWRMPKRTQRIVNSAYGIGHGIRSVREIARQEGMTVPAVVRTLQAVRRALGEILDPGCRQLSAFDAVPVIRSSPWVERIRSSLGDPVPPARRRRLQCIDQMELQIAGQRARRSRAH